MCTHHAALLKDHKLIVLLATTIRDANLRIYRVMKALCSIACVFERWVALVLVMPIRAISVAY